LGALRTFPEGIEQLYGWMTENWEELTKKFPAGLSMLGSIVSICTSSFTSPAQLDRIQAFFADKNTKGFDQSLAQSSDAIRAKSAWLARDREDVKAWVEGYKAKTIKAEL
jgi:aminopeptidase 2